MVTMFSDWIHWLSSTPTNELLWLALPMLVFDVSRYLVGSVLIWVCDFAALLKATLLRRQEARFSHCPSVCVVIAGMNEGNTIGHTLASVWGTYPRLQIIVVDDGSSDNMTDVAMRFADEHDGILVLRKPQRGGKSSALNFAMPFVRAEIVACIDGDSQVNPTTIWELVQPFEDPSIGAVAGAIVARNPFTNLVTWLQALEYLRCIFLGRMFTSRMDILGVISGALGAYRFDAVRRMRGWDVGPGEDGDLTLRLRKVGYRIAYQPYAQCRTNLPTRWGQLIRQRRRWQWAVITFECRKHIDLANLWSRNFRPANLALLLERWVFDIVLVYANWAFIAWWLWNWDENSFFLAIYYYALYLAAELVQLGIILYYSTNRRRDLAIGAVLPLMPMYQMLQRGVSLWSIAEEIMTRRSFRDSFVPAHVRDRTWHW